MKTRTMIGSGLVALLMATVMTGTVFAQGPRDPSRAGGGPRRSAATTVARGFVDEDGDGVNDRYAEGDGAPYYETHETGYGFVDEDGDGLNDRRAGGNGIPVGDGTEAGYGYGFVDEDGDGVNDRYVDLDGDGVPDCDGEVPGPRGRWSR